MTDRQLATIRVISQLKPIQGADLIEVAVIDGWEVVIKKGEYNVGDLCVYLEIDSWVPTELAPFLSKGKEPREYKGVKGERLKTIRLKGQVSQGLVLPLQTVLDLPNNTGCDVAYTDVTEALNILKWEREIPAQLAGKMAGNFPQFIPKTDQNRIQNYLRTVEQLGESLWEVTEKLDGSSMTVFRTIDPDGSSRIGVCSRNWELKVDDLDNAFVKTAWNEKLFEKLSAYNLNVALQGELLAPGIQGNAYCMHEPTFYVFDIWDIEAQKYYSTEQRTKLCQSLSVKHAPVFANYLTTGMTTVSELLTFAEGQSVLNPKTQREGLVFKNINNPSLSFKAISNLWLLKND